MKSNLKSYKMSEKTFASIIIAIFLIAATVVTVANITNRDSGVTGTETEESFEERLSAVEMELKEIQENNRFCSIIGAYTIINESVTKPTKDNVAALVSICDCWYPDIIMAQYQLESACGTSQVAKRNNNLFGMRKAFTRKSVRCRTFDKAGYAVYNNWQLSVIDRIFWEEHEFHNIKPTRTEYLAKIKRIYAEDTEYIGKIKRIAEDYKEYFGIE